MPLSAPSHTRRAALLVTGAGAAFATSGPLAFWAAPTHPFAIVFGRVALAALALGIAEVARDAGGIRAALAGLSSRQRWGVPLAGLLLGAHFVCFVAGLQRTSLPAAVSLVSLEPLSVVLWALALQGIRPTVAEQAGVLVASLGALLVARGAGQGAHRVEGDLLVLVAVLLFGLYVAAARAFRGDLSATRYAALVYAAAALGTACALPFAPALALSPRGALGILGLALVPTLVGHTLVQAAAQRMSPAVVALVCPAETVGGLVIGAGLLGATPQPIELAGAAVVVAGVLLALPRAR